MQVAASAVNVTPFRVAVVVPTLGQRPDMLRECLASIRIQEPQPEVRLVSTAEGCELLLAAGIGDVPVALQTRPGIAGAIQDAWDTLGDDVDMVTWIGDDDRLCPGSLRIAAELLRANPDCAMVYGQIRFIDYQGNERVTVRPGRIARTFMALGQNIIGQPGCLYRRAAVTAIGGLDLSYQLAFDVDLHRRLMAAGGAIYAPMVLAEARSHPESLTTAQHERSRDEARRALRPRRRLAASALQKSGPIISLLGTIAYRFMRDYPRSAAPKDASE